MLSVACVNTGDRYPDIYVDRLYRMVQRHLSMPFRFVCYTDRPRPLDPAVQQADASSWGLSGWFAKLRLFDGELLNGEPLLYIDLSAIIRSSLDPMVSYAHGHPFVAVRDWNYDCLNSCVMWISPCAETQGIWDAYRTGVRYQSPLKGDQDYIDDHVREHGLHDWVTWWPPEWVISYRRLFRVHRRSHFTAMDVLSRSIVVKFHGTPRPHQLGDWRVMTMLYLRYPSAYLHARPQMVHHLRDAWR